jgi:hypothetical protein
MATNEEKKQFYEQFNTVIHLHQEWLNSPQGLLEVIQQPWKGQAPIVYVDVPGETSAASVLRQIKQRYGERK